MLRSVVEDFAVGTYCQPKISKPPAAKAPSTARMVDVVPDLSGFRLASSARISWTLGMYFAAGGSQAPLISLD
jgi:hypothetical protein